MGPLKLVKQPLPTASNPPVPFLRSQWSPSVGPVQLGDVHQGGHALLRAGGNPHLVQTHGQRPRLDLHQQAVDLPHHLAAKGAGEAKQKWQKDMAYFEEIIGMFQ